MNWQRTMRRREWLAGLALAAGSVVARGAVGADSGRRLMFFEYGKGPNRLLEIGGDGKVLWLHVPPRIAVIFQILENGHVLYAYGGKPTVVRELTREGKEVWNYVSECPQVLETSVENYHLQVRNVHQLANGNILAAHEGEGAVREVDPQGKVVWEYTGVENAGDAQRLPNGNTLISCGTQKRVIEVTGEGKVAWEFGAQDAPEVNFTWASSVQRLKNGNLLIGNFLRGQEGKGAHAFEVTRDKRVVWTYSDHNLVKSLTTVRAVGE